MNKKQLVEELALRLNITEVGAEKFISEFQKVVMEVVASGERMTLVNFLTFGVKYRGPVQRRNPGTGEKVISPEVWRVHARVGNGFRAYVQKEFKNRKV